jgi:hypothetical protein
MSKVFIRSHYRYPTGAAIPPTGIRPILSSAHWSKFDNLLKTCLSELGHEVIEQQAAPSVADDFQDAKFRIYAHKTRRDVAGDLFYKQTHLPELFTIDTLGWGADHSGMQSQPDWSSVEPSAAEAFCAALLDKFWATGGSKLPQPSRDVAPSLPDDYIFVPTQTPRDYVQLHHAPVSVLAFVHLIAAWANDARQNVVFKLHPGLYQTSECDREIIDAVNHYAATSDFVFRQDANIHDLIGGARGVFTINSGVGFESLIHGKPVVTFGNCDYKWVTFRAHQHNIDEAGAYVSGYTQAARREAYRFVYYYFFHHAFSIEEAFIEESRRRLLAYLSHVMET